MNEALSPDFRVAGEMPARTQRHGSTRTRQET